MNASKKTSVLVADDDPRLLKLVQRNLELNGYRVLTAMDGTNALKMAEAEELDLLLLDIMMPGMDGFETLRRLRTFSQVPVLILTAKDDEEDRIKGLELGADDYIGKPFSHRELVSRIRAVLRRHYAAPPTPQTTVKVDDRLTIDFARREVLVNGERVNLRPTEYRLLYHLVQNAGYVMTHEQLLTRVWGPEYRDETHYLRLYITYLRQKLEEDPANPKYILTERGIGYRFVDLNKNSGVRSQESE
jgi:two-component system, OmpR family, KDP operon response regulator KdpE